MSPRPKPKPWVIVETPACAAAPGPCGCWPPTEGLHSNQERLHRVLGYAVRKKRLTQNPPRQSQPAPRLDTPAGPRRHPRPARRRQPRPGRRHDQSLWPVGRRQGPRFQAFYGCMFYALMRPSEVAALTKPVAALAKASYYLPETGWGHLTFADASPPQAAPTPTTARSMSTAASKAAPRTGPPRTPARSPSRPSSSSSSAPTSRRTAPPRTAGCSGPRPATRSSPPLGGRSGRKSGPRCLPPTSSPPRS